MTTLAPNWIDYRASRARVDRRLDAHEQVPTCEHCGCETDIRPVPHSPRCPTVTGEPLDTEEEEDVPADDGLRALEAMDAGEPQPRHQTEETVMVECKIDGCSRDASDAPKAGPTSRLCAVHRAERSARLSAERTGVPRGGAKTRRASPPRVAPPTPAEPAAVANGSLVSKAERLLACARAVDELQAQLEQARADLKAAAEALL